MSIKTILTDLIQGRLDKHYGPGHHRGTGSPRIAHGRREGHSPKRKALQRIKEGRFSWEDVVAVAEPDKSGVISSNKAHEFLDTLGVTDPDSRRYVLRNSEAPIWGYDAMEIAILGTAKSAEVDKVDLRMTNKRLKDTSIITIEDNEFMKGDNPLFDQFVERAKNMQRQPNGMLDNTEIAVTIDSKGDAFIDDKDGTRNASSVAFDYEDVRRFWAMDDAHIVHNHPTGKGFSDEDIASPLMMGVKGITAISTFPANEGTYFTVAFNPNMNFFEVAKLYNTFKDTRKMVKPFIDRDFLSGILSSDRAWTELTANTLMQLERMYPNLIDYQTDYTHWKFGFPGWEDTSK